MRKATQLTHVGNQLVALCDDGTIWVLSDTYKSGYIMEKSWHQVKEIPQ